MNRITRFRATFVNSASGARRHITLALFLLFPFALVGCPGGSKQGPGANSATTPPAASPASSATVANSPFDGERALELVRKQVEFGPRPGGSAQLERTRNFIIGELKSYGLNVTTDEFHPKTPLGDKKLMNITAELPASAVDIPSRDVIIISSHYDTKLFKKFRFVGANDGASSTAALMELARVMATTKADRRFTYWFVFFDGEESFCEEWDQCSKPGAPDNTYGSRRYVEQLQSRNELSRVRAMILLDMIGYKDLNFGRDDLSSTWLVDIVWRTAKELGYGSVFQDRIEGVGGDDHEPFLRAGVDALDIIQLSNYKSPSGEEYWHTAGDTLDKISAKSLKIVGDVMLTSLPKIEARLGSKR
ncbi:MAG TPA: M28 family metallopeptidase [Pyrinomonadaceae bacterium]